VCPIYNYQCHDCRCTEKRVAGLDDHLALCTHCGGLMHRQDQDVFAPYFSQQPDCPWCVGRHEGTSRIRICPRHAAELREEMENLKPHQSQPAGFLY
jgi:hypothetical protein